MAARTRGFDVDQPHLDRRERVFEVHLLFGVDARLHAFVDPLVLGAPIDVAFGLIDVLAAATEAQHRPAHRFDRAVAAGAEHVGPTDLPAVFLLPTPTPAAPLSIVPVIA